MLIPTYQRREVVCAAVEALAKSEYDGQVEVIIAVDGSTDGTADALTSLDLPFSLRVLQQPNRGAAAARNRAAAEAANEILLFLDDDMLCAPDMIAHHADSYLEGADAVVGDARRDPGSPRGFMSDTNELWLSRKRGPLTLFDIWTGQLSVRRSVFEEVGGFDEEYTDAKSFANEDADFGIRLLAKYEVRHNPAAISYQRYVVSPHELMRRAPLRAAGDVRLASKYPEVARSVFEARRVSHWTTRYLFGPISAIPVLPQIWAAIAVPLAGVALQTPLRSSRTLASFFLAARATLYWAAMRRLGWYPLSDRLLILGYHAVDDWSDDEALRRYAVPRPLFLQHLRSLSRRGFQFITPETAAQYLAHAAPLPQRAVLLTFDDCYADLPAVAREILQPRSIEAVAFPVTGVPSATNEWDRHQGGRVRHLLDAEQLRQLRSLGIELGSHSRTHRSLPGLSYDEQGEEIDGSAGDLEGLGLPRPRFFAHPYGEVDAKVRRAVSEGGYIAALGIKQAWVEPSSDRFDLPRLIIHASDRSWRFRLRTSAPKLFERLDIAQAKVRTFFFRHR